MTYTRLTRLPLLLLCLPTIAFADPKSILESRCVDCHNGVKASGGVDLTILFSKTAKPERVAKLWTRAEKMVAERKMPPKRKTPLGDDERSAILTWYRNTYILRDGKEHIGATPLRRLTRYELENTLEHLLAVPLKRPYVVSTESDALLPSTIQTIYPRDTPGESGFDNDADHLKNVKVPLVKYIACIDYALRIFDQNDDARKQVLGFTDKTKSIDADEAKRILGRFAKQAWRTRHDADELDHLVRTWERAAKRTTAYKALLHSMKVALLSPSFVFRLEHAKGRAEPYPVAGRELAVRLSYFLWSSAPDDELLAAGDDGRLLTDAGLRRQLRRMLDSPKRIALSENFAGQWLGFEELLRNKAFYRGQHWTRSVYDELLFGFDELIKSDLGILDIVQADWAYLHNPRSAGGRTRPHKFEEQYRDIFADRRSRKGLKVERFYNPPRLYKVESDRVGGLVTSAGIMRLTSAPNRTSPIRRGVWILERIIGEEMEPPENIPPLAESEKKLKSQPAAGRADILKLHTSRASCRACHEHIDPLGLGLENFSPNGDWRTNYPDRKPIVSAGKLPNGQAFASPAELKRELLAYYKDKIVDTIVRKMLAYAIGRALRPHDRITVEKIHSALRTNDYRMGMLLEQIVMSKQFRYRQDKP